MFFYLPLSVFIDRAGNGWWWVPLVAPPIGGVLGAGIYKALVELHHPHVDELGERLLEELKEDTVYKKNCENTIVQETQLC